LKINAISVILVRMNRNLSRKLFFFTFICVFCANLAYSLDRPSFEISGGLSKTFNASWNEMSILTMNKFINYNIENGDFTKVEGNLCQTRLGLSFGVNMDLDNNKVNEASKIMGYIGFRNIFLRYQNGSLIGTTEWNSTLVPGQTKFTAFETSLTHVEMLYWFRKMFGGQMPGYWGLSYTSFALPNEIRTLKTNTGIEDQVYANPFLDPDYKGKYYALLFGMDSFESSMLYFDSVKNGEEFGAGFGIFFTAEDRFGFGTDTISDEGLRRARLLNPGLTPVGQSFFSYFLENNSSMGIRWRNTSGKVRFAIGIGYELDFFFSGIFLGSAAEKKGDLGFQNQTAMARTGPILRCSARW
jgi:hypothetical protein